MPANQEHGHAFLKIREVTLGDSSLEHMEKKLSPLGDRTRSITDRIHQKYAIQNWDIARLRTYVDMLQAFGFNSIELYDLWQAYLNAGWGTDPKDWPEKMDAMADYARSRRMRTTLFLWGNAGFEYNERKPHFHLCWNDPAERDILEHYWEHQARHAAHFDHVVTHWGDPGGCERNGCTIETAQHLHLEILRRLRANNPTMQSTFSLWMLHHPRFSKWAGYEGPHTVLQSGILPPEVMIAVHSSPSDFNFDTVRQIAQAGRKVGVWCWYLANHEVTPSCYVRTSRLKDYFADLPEEAHELIEWHSLDANNHGLNIHNLFVAGRLMRDPHADAQAVLREFIAGAFGAENVDRVEKILLTIEKARNCPGYRDDPQATPEQARDAHRLAREISIADTFSPAFPMVLSPRELAGELVAQTEAIAQFLEFRAGARDVEQMKRRGASPEQIDAAIAELPAVDRPSDWMTNMEYCLYLARLDDLKEETQVAEPA